MAATPSSDLNAVKPCSTINHKHKKKNKKIMMMMMMMVIRNVIKTNMKINEYGMDLIVNQGICDYVISI